MSLHRALAEAARAFTHGSDLDPETVHRSLFAEFARQADANARIGVLACWFLNVFLGRLPQRKCRGHTKSGGKSGAKTSLKHRLRTGWVLPVRGWPVLLARFATTVQKFWSMSSRDA